ncbi:MAG: hspA 2 [Gammaproteobacteria bacterium]|jgi:HSP20 family protein|nr:hspA 2 [Gammaproteobacteria bacterium]
MPTYLAPYEKVNLINELNSMMENIVNRGLSADDSKVATSRWLPAVDIKEEAGAFIIFADLPGVDPKHVDVSMENNVLTIKGSRAHTREENKDKFHRLERIEGEFYRRFTLPDTADGENIKAKARQGVLELTIPKKKIAQSRKIDIKVED